MTYDDIGNVVADRDRWSRYIWKPASHRIVHISEGHGFSEKLEHWVRGEWLVKWLSNFASSFKTAKSTFNALRWFTITLLHYWKDYRLISFWMQRFKVLGGQDLLSLVTRCNLQLLEVSKALPSKKRKARWVKMDQFEFSHLHKIRKCLTSGSDSMELGGVSLCGVSSWACPGLLELMLGGGRWNNLAWSCWAHGQGSVPLTHSTGSSHPAFWPWTWSIRTHE